MVWTTNINYSGASFLYFTDLDFLYSHETLTYDATDNSRDEGYKVASNYNIDYQAAFLNAPSKHGEKHVMRVNKHEAIILGTIDPNIKQYLQHDGTIFVQLEKTFLIPIYMVFLL